VSGRTLKIALAASVALNLFGIAGGVAAWVTRDKVDSHLEGQRPAGRPSPFREIMAGLDPAVRDRVRMTMRASAQAARPDFQQAREARRMAVTLSASPDGNPAQITALLEQSRAAEMRGRARLERDSVALLATLGPRDRQALSVVLNRRGRESRGGRDDDRGRTGLRQKPEETPSPVT